MLVIMALYRLSRPMDLTTLMQTFNMGRGTAVKTLDVYAAIVETMRKTWIQDLAPTTEERKVQYGAGFAARAGSQAFSRCVGALDGTHFKVLTEFAATDMRPYMNRKGHASINIQV